jgi:hypothetical protein
MDKSKRRDMINSAFKWREMQKIKEQNITIEQAYQFILLLMFYGQLMTIYNINYKNPCFTH